VYKRQDPKIIYNLGQVFVDGAMYMQAPLKAEMEEEPGSWYYHSPTKQLYIHFFKDGPQEHVVEITTRRRIFAPHERGFGFIEVDGFVMEHCGNQYPANFADQDHPEWQQAGALGTRSGHDWVIRNNIIRLTNGIGMDLGEEGHWAVDLEKAPKAKHGLAGHHLIEANYLIDNGAAGISAYNAAHLLIKGNVITGNNAWGFTGPRRTQGAGIKLHNPEHSIIDQNYIGYNIGRVGVSFEDGAGQDTRFTRNVVAGHDVGMEVETGSAKEAVLGNNLFIENKIGLSCRESGGLTVLNNLFVGSDGHSVKATVDSKREGKWSSTNLSFYNNIMKGRGVYFEITHPDSYRSEGRAFDYNIYDATPKDVRWKLIGSGDYVFEAWKEAMKKVNRDKASDQHSVASKGVLYSFDAAKNRLTLILPMDPASLGGQRDKRLLTDYFGASLPVEGTLRPGPFKAVQQGRNDFVIWTGIPVPPRQSPWARMQ
jgi:hypothetical protein